MGTSQSSHEVFMQGIANLFNSELYSDAQVRCKNGDTYPCHKAVLCTQSKFFANALGPKLGSKDSQDNAITIPDEDPMIVRALLEFLYRFDYSVPKNMSLEAQLDFHIRIYNIGEFQDVEDLKRTAQICFNTLLSENWNHSIFETAIRLAYKAAAGSDRGLKDPIVEYAIGKLDELKEDQNFLNVMAEVGDFGGDLTLAILKGKGCRDVKVQCHQSNRSRNASSIDSSNFVIHEILFSGLRNFIRNVIKWC